MTLSLDKEVNAAITAAREATQIVLAVYRRDFSVELKHGREPVTLADTKANALLCERISSAFPDDGIIAEESVPTDPAELASILQRERVWFIDPLDGTKEFIARNGEFAIMIGLAIAGDARVGVVSIPTTGELLVGVVGQDAWQLTPRGDRSPLRVSDVSELAEATLVASRSHRSKALDSVIAALAPSRQLPCGSVGVKAFRLVSRQADIYVNLPGGSKLWDGCAPEAIVRAAGGRVSDLAGDPIDYASNDLVLSRGYVATNGGLHEAVVNVTRTHRV